MTCTSRLFWALPLVVVVFGCSNSKTPSGVSGKVTYKGEILQGGTITFHRTAQDQVGAYAFAINTDGTYVGTNMPAEEMIVTVETESLNPNRPTQTYAGRGNPADKQTEMMKERGFVKSSPGEGGNYKKIPPQYADKAKSPLKVTLAKGKKEYNFDLQD
jgi:hypothetical protein